MFNVFYSFYSLDIFAKSSILYARLFSEYASDINA